MVEYKEIRKAYGDNEVLKGVSCTVQTGSVTVILGPSGSGKTTLLRCTNFLERADSGVIRLDDLTVDAHHASHKEVHALREKTAMVFQHYNLFRNKTVLQNVTESLRVVHRMPKKEAEDKALHYLEKVGMAAKRIRTPIRFRAASSSASRSRGRWPSSPRSSCSTSRPRRSTPSWSARCSRR